MFVHGKITCKSNKCPFFKLLVSCFDEWISHVYFLEEGDGSCFSPSDNPQMRIVSFMWLGCFFTYREKRSEQGTRQIPSPSPPHPVHFPHIPPHHLSTLTEVQSTFVHFTLCLYCSSWYACCQTDLSLEWCILCLKWNDRNNTAYRWVLDEVLLLGFIQVT